MDFSLQRPPVNPIPGSEFPPPPRVLKVGSGSLDAEPLYICCGKPFGGKFMIFCEKCEQWLHGECIDIEQSYANNIDKFYCKSCISKDNSLEIVFTKKYILKLEKKKREETDIIAKRCGTCLTCLKVIENDNSSCKNCTYCQNGQSILCLALRCIQVPSIRKKAGRPRKEATLTRSASESEDPASPRSQTEDKPKRGRKKGWNKVKAMEKIAKAEADDADRKTQEEIDREIARQVYREANMRARAAKRKDSVEEPAKQCLGIECTQEARPSSKYCSDDCGKSIARARLLQFLPRKIEEYWKIMPSSEIRYRAMAQEKESQIVALSTRLSDLVGMAAMLERYANSLTKAEPDAGEGGSSEIDGIICCTVCGVECTTRQLPNHIYRCFVRSEKQSNFGSQVQDNQYAIFCNVYNKASDTYCKRLKLMCPEHYKGELENNMKVCGCPKIWDLIKDRIPSFQEVFVSAEQLMSKRFCLAPRKECTKHTRWLQISLSIINNERLNYLYKLNELQDAYLSFTNANGLHGDVVTLLCFGKNGLKNPVKKEELMEA